MTTKQATSPIEKAAMAVIRNAGATAKQLAALSGISPAIDRRLANHANAGAALLEKLAHSSDKTTRKRVALNANTLKEMLVRLAPQFPGDFFKNPVFDWLLLEEPDLLTRIGGGVMKNILKRPDCPESFLRWAVAHGNEQEKLAVAMNPDAPLDALRTLAKTYSDVADAAHAHVKMVLDSGVPLPISSDLNPSAVERHETAIPLADIVKNELGNLSNRQVKQYWQRRYLGPSQWLWLNPEQRLKVLDLPAIVFYRDWLLRHADSLRLAEENGFETPFQLREELKLLSDSLAAAAYREDRLEKMIAAQQVITRIHGEGITLGVLQMLARDVSLRNDLLGSEDCPLVLLEHFGKHRNADHRERVAANPACPPDVIAILAKDSVERVRSAVAGNHRTPHDVLQSLADDINRSVRCALAWNDACPVNLMARLADDKKYPAAMEAIAENPYSSPDLLRKLFDESIRSFRFYRSSERLIFILLMNHHACPGDILERIAAEFPLFRRTVAKQPNCPTSVLESLANNTDREIRLVVAANPSTPEVLRQTLFQQLVADPDMLGLRELIRLQETPDLFKEQAGARLWWLSMKALTREYPSRDLLDTLANDEDTPALMTLLRAEAACMIDNPLTSLAARVIGADEGHLLILDPASADSACRSGGLVVRLLGLCQPHASPQQLAKRVTSTDWTERLAIASNPACPSGLLSRLMTDAHTAVAAQARATHAARPNRIAQLEAEIIQTQENEPDLGVLAIEIAARLLHCEQAGSVLGTRWEKYLAIDQRLGLRGNEKFWPVIALLPSATGDTIWRLLVDKKYPKLGWAKVVKSKRSEQRAFAAGVPGCPIELLQHFANDGSYLVRVAVIRNPSCPPEIVEFLSDESHEFVQEAVEERRMAAAVLRELLARDDYPEESIWGKHPLVIRVALECLALPLPAPYLSSGSAAERLLIAVHPAFPSDKRAGLISKVALMIEKWLNATPPVMDAERWTREDFALPLTVLGLVSQESDGQAIAMAAKSRDWLTRAAVTFSPSATPHVLRLLFDDPHKVVKWLAACRLATIKSPKVPSADR